MTGLSCLAIINADVPNIYLNLANNNVENKCSNEDLFTNRLIYPQIDWC